MKPTQYIRRYETDYAGAWKGSCKSRESAINAAVKHVTLDGYTRATITDRATGLVVARVSLADSRRAVTITTETQLRKVR